MRQNYYVQLDGTGHITDVSDTYKQGYIPVAVDMGHMEEFQFKSPRMTYNSNLHALQYAPMTPPFGVYYDGSSNPQLKRIDGSVGAIAGINGNLNDFDSAAPWSEIHEVKDSKGNQFESIPPFYVHRTQNSSTGAEKLEISPTPVQGWYLPKCFIDPKNQSVHNIWVGRYLGDSSENPLTSVSGQTIGMPDMEDSRNVAIANNPNGSQNGPYALLDVHIWAALQDLFTVEFATLDSKAVFYNSQGGNIQVPTAQSATAFGIQPNNAGTNDGLKGSSNYNSSSQTMSYRGIENLFGFNGNWCDGIDPASNSIGLDYTQYNSNGTGYVSLSYTMNSGNISQEGYDPKYPDIRYATQFNADDNADNYYCDYSGAGDDDSVLCVGGVGYSYAGYVGLWSAAAADSTGYASPRLTYHPLG